LSSFALGIELANAGNGIASAAQELYGCTNLSNDPTKSIRPVPVLITDGGSADTPDEFSVFYSASRSLVTPIDIQNNVDAGADIKVQSPLDGGRASFRPNDMIVAINIGGQCTRSIVTAVTAPDAGGFVLLSQSVQDGTAVKFSDASKVLNLGPSNRVQRVRYYVDPATNVLYSRNLFNPDAAPVPLASGVVNVKVQYGVDANNDGYLDDWVSAGEAGWDATKLMSNAGTTIQQLSSIKAVRIAIVTRSEQFDKDVTDDFKHPLFNCPANDGTCDGRLEITAPKNWRYRVFETVIPLRNVIWNREL
jgi:type IV pilus assembly protein PilW